MHKLGVLAGIDGHDVAIDDGHGAARRRHHEVAVHFEYCPLADQPLWQVLARQLACRLQLFIPVACLTRDVLLVAETR